MNNFAKFISSIIFYESVHLREKHYRRSFTRGYL